MLISSILFFLLNAPRVSAAGLSSLSYAAFTESRTQLNTFSELSLNSFDHSIELPSNAAMVSLYMETSSSVSLKDDDGNSYPFSGGYFHAMPVDDNTTFYLTVNGIGTYTINFTKQAPLSDDASITSAYYEFYDTNGTRLVGQQFNGFTDATEYSFDMPEGSYYFTFQPNVASGASVSYTAAGKSVQYSHIPADAGSVTVTVTAAAGNTKTYTINFNAVKEESSSSESSSSEESSSESSSETSSEQLSSSQQSSTSSETSQSSSSKTSSLKPKSLPKQILITDSLSSSFLIFAVALGAIVIVIVMVLRTGLHKKD